MIRQIRNFIGDIRGIARCYECKDSFNWKKWYDVLYEPNSSMFPICKECWNKLNPERRFFWCRYLLNEWVSTSPLDFPQDRIEKILKKLEEQSTHKQEVKGTNG